MTRTVTINGQPFELDSQAIERALAEALPEPLHEHFVVIGGRRYPPKQVISLVTGLDRADFTTHQARRILLRLGFPASRRSRGSSAREEAPRRAGRHGGRGADALRPFIGQWVAIRGQEVLVAAESPREIVAWLARHGQTAESMFRVPEDEGATAGAAPA